MNKISFNRDSIRRAALTFSCMTLTHIISLAQDAGATGAFTKIATDIKGYQGPVKNILYAIASVIALVGAFNIYHKMTNGDQDVKKTIMLTLGGCIGFVALAAALPEFFK